MKEWCYDPASGIWELITATHRAFVIRRTDCSLWIPYLQTRDTAWWGPFFARQHDAKRWCELQRIVARARQRVRERERSA